MWKLVFNVADVIFWFGKKPKKSKGIMPHLKLFKKFENKIKFATHMDLWKYGQILTILTINHIV
jgi:hypothetical protein